MTHKFRFSISIPSGAKVLVNTGQVLNKGDVLAEVVSNKEVEVMVAKGLGVAPKAIGKFLTVALGQSVKKEDVVAKTKGILGIREVKSTVAGTVHTISETNGSLWIKTKAEESEKVMNPVAGLVVELSDSKIVVEVIGRAWEGERAEGGITQGNLDSIGEWGTSRLDQLTSGSEGRIVVVADKVNSAWLAKASALGLAGVVCAGIPDDTGGHSGISILVMPSGENGQMDKNIWDNLVKLSGNPAFMYPKERLLGVIEGKV